MDDEAQTTRWIESITVYIPLPQGVDVDTFIQELKQTLEEALPDGLNVSLEYTWSGE